MQMAADIPGMPDFYSHRANKDPEPGLPPGWSRRRRIALVQRTHETIRMISAEMAELACLAENYIQDQPGRRMEGRLLAIALKVPVQRLAYALAGHPRVQKEYGPASRATGKPGKEWRKEGVYYLL